MNALFHIQTRVRLTPHQVLFGCNSCKSDELQLICICSFNKYLPNWKIVATLDFCTPDDNLRQTYKNPPQCLQQCGKKAAAVVH